MAIFIALILILALLAIIGMYYYNKLVALTVRVKEGWSDILIQLKRRHDLIGNLIETVKGYTKYEAGTLDKIIEARNAAKTVEGGSPQAVLSAENTLNTALRGINFSALSEAYPDLKANTSFNQLQSELSDTENKIAASRRFYNTVVSSLNTAIRQFPDNLFVNMAGAVPAEFFEMDEAEVKVASEAPQVKF